MRRSTFILTLFFALTASAQQLTVGNLKVGTLIQLPPGWGTLGYAINTNVAALAANTNTGSYSTLTLATNSGVWTWPVNLSCVGRGSDGFQHVLLTPNVVLVNDHYGPAVGQTVTFTGTDGIQYTQAISNLFYSIGDLVLAQMSNSYPASVVPPWIFPPNYTNYLAGHTPVGLNGFYPHSNTAQLEQCNVNNWFHNFVTPWWLTYAMGFNANDHHPGTYPTAGDSCGPFFMVLNNRPIVLFATTSTSAEGCGVSDPPYFSFITNSLGGTNGLKILNLSNYPTR
jgi:hypothetical protein